jgi:hypothetical protein
MAWATKYYYNRNRFQVSIKCTGSKVYYLPPRCYSYVKEELANDFTLPNNVVVYNNPVWWNDNLWPWNKPWGPQPQP